MFEKYMRLGPWLCAIFCFLLFGGAAPALANDMYGIERPAQGLPKNVEDALNELLASKDPSKTVPSQAMLEYIIDFMLDGKTTYANTKPNDRPEGTGFYWRDKFNLPFKDFLEYVYNPEIPTEAVYPASVRHCRWLNGSDILKQDKPLWESLNGLDRPLVLRGVEQEEITPDDFSGSYYSYTLDRLLILMPYQGKPMLISVSWQRDKSSMGRQGGFLGNYEDWNFIYTEEKGGTLKSIGWAETYMYASCSVNLLFMDGPNNSQTGYALLKWLKAGWSGMNMVERKHLKSGAERSLEGLKAVLESPTKPTPKEIATKYKELIAMQNDKLCSVASPYGTGIEGRTGENDVFKTEPFKKVIAGGAYAQTLSKDNLVALLLVDYIKQAIGKPSLMSSSKEGLKIPSDTAAQ